MKLLVRTVGTKVSIAAVLLANTAMGDILYRNTTADLSTRFNVGLSEVGDQVILSGGANSAAQLFQINQFSLSYYGLNFSGNETMQVRFYANNGLQYDVNTKVPGSVLWDSGEFAVGQTSRSTLTFDQDFSAGVVVPKEFTWSVLFKGVSSGEEAGVDLFSPPTVGNNYSDYWVNTGVGWVLAKGENQSIDFGAEIQGVVVPEPTSLFFLGGVLLGLPAIWRKLR